MATFEPISFLPNAEKLDTALQNLAKTQQAIGNAKIQEMQGQINAFNNLLDVSLEGLMTKHQEEVVGDLDRFKTKAAEMYRSAFAAGERPNYKAISELNTDKKQILYKVNQSKFLQDQYKAAMLAASKLQSEGVLDPTTKPNLDAWRAGSQKIEDTVDPMSYVKRNYGFNEAWAEMDKYMKPAQNPTTLVNGALEITQYDATKDLMSLLPNNPRMTRTLVGYYGSPERLMEVAKERYGIYKEHARSNNSFNINVGPGGEGVRTPYIKADLTDVRNKSDLGTGYQFNTTSRSDSYRRGNATYYPNNMYITKSGQIRLQGTVDIPKTRSETPTTTTVRNIANQVTLDGNKHQLNGNKSDGFFIIYDGQNVPVKVKKFSSSGVPTEVEITYNPAFGGYTETYDVPLEEHESEMRLKYTDKVIESMMQNLIPTVENKYLSKEEINKMASVIAEENIKSGWAGKIQKIKQNPFE